MGYDSSTLTSALTSALTSSLTSALTSALAEIEARIAAACARAKRSPDEVTLVGVTKLHPAALLDAAHAAGVRHVGENYAQELSEKFDQQSDPSRLVWHFIGQLQRNKVKLVVGRADIIHAVDSERLATAIEQQAARAAAQDALTGGRQRVLMAVNVGGEAQKSGVSENAAAALLTHIAALPHLDCVGLMTMPPFAQTAAQNRPYFQRLAALRATLATAHPRLEQLSMGTTADFEVAIEEGATMVRVGTALFGPRPTP